MSKPVDYYELLEVSKSATQDQIKTQYKKLAKKWHPDKNQKNIEIATEKFKQISRAYEVLSDPGKKEMYDNYGTNFEDEDEDNDSNDETNPFAKFNEIFGNMGMHMGMGMHMRDDDDDDDNEVPDCINYIEVSIEDLYNGSTIEKEFDRYSQCEKCNGHGTKNGKTACCKKCKGAGNIPTMVAKGIVVPIPCHSCGGTCVDQNAVKCTECNGAKFIQETVAIDIDIPKGAFDKYNIMVEEEGNAIPPEEIKIVGAPRSDAIFIIKEKTHEKFKRGLIIPGKSKIDNADLMVEVNVSFAESLLGFSKSIEHPSGTNIEVHLTEPCRHKDDMIIVGQGMPDIKDSTKRGDLYVRLLVDHPRDSNFTNKQKENIVKTFKYTPPAVKKGSIELVNQKQYAETLQSQQDEDEDEDEDEYEQSQESNSLEDSEQSKSDVKRGGRPPKQNTSTAMVNQPNSCSKTMTSTTNGGKTKVTTTTNKNGSTTTTCTNITLNGNSNFDLSSIPGLESLSSIPGLENIPGLAGLFKKKDDIKEKTPKKKMKK
jgi:DnaJ-class molecular chaperone